MIGSGRIESDRVALIGHAPGTTAESARVVELDASTVQRAHLPRHLTDSVTSYPPVAFVTCYPGGDVPTAERDIPGRVLTTAKRATTVPPDRLTG